MRSRDFTQDRIDQIAAEWAVRLAGGPLSGDERRRLDDWLAQCPRHGEALDEAGTAWSHMGAVARRGPFPAPGPARFVSSRRVFPALAACLALAVWAGGALWRGGLSEAVGALAADYRSGPGELRDVTLPDGSVLRLGPRSALSLRWSDEVRGIELRQGQVHVVAAPRTGPETRPFLVYSAGGGARALGTRFTVRRDASGVEVVVLEHQVEVASGEGEGAGRVVVSPGQAVRYGDGALSGPVRRVSSDLAAAWTEGRIVFDRTPLAEVAAELERLRGGRVVVADSALASRVVSGVFDASDPDGALATIGRVLGIKVVSAPLLTVLY